MLAHAQDAKQLSGATWFTYYMSNVANVANPPSQIKTFYTIRPSIEQDLEPIYETLADYVEHRGYADRCEDIAQAHREGRLIVYEDGESHLPKGFLLSDLESVEARDSLGGGEIERRLVDYDIERAKQQNESYLLLECRSSSEAEFWKEMGFTFYRKPEKQANTAYQLLPRVFWLPAGKPVKVSITFDTPGSWQERHAPFQISTPAAVLTDEGIVRLDQRVAFCQEIHGIKGDVVVTIAVNGRTAYSGKVKEPEAALVGIRRSTHAFYIDAIDTTKLALA